MALASSRLLTPPEAFTPISGPTVLRMSSMSATVAPPFETGTGDPVMNLPWTQAGLPAATLPAGRGTSGLPLGFQIIGRFGRDEALAGWLPGLAAALSGD